MATNAPKIASLDCARFAKIEAEREILQSKLANNEAQMKDFCRRYSDEHGFNVRLTAEQVRRDMEARG